MPAPGEPASPRGAERAPHIDPKLVEQLYTLARAERWQLEKGKFGDILLRTVAHHFRGANPSGSAVEAFCQSLHVEDLALASACAVGSEPAWEHFIREFRRFTGKAPSQFLVTAWCT